MFAKFTEPLQKLRTSLNYDKGVAYGQRAAAWARSNLTDGAIARRVMAGGGSRIPPGISGFINSGRGPGGGFAMIGAALGAGLGGAKTALDGDGRYARRMTAGAVVGGVTGAALDPRARALAVSGYQKAAQFLNRFRK